MTKVWRSGVPACMRIVRSQKAPTATVRTVSAPIVTRNGRERSSKATAVRSVPNRRATTGAARPAVAVTTEAIEKYAPI